MIFIALLLLGASLISPAAAAEGPPSVIIDRGPRKEVSTASGSLRIGFIEENLDVPAGGFALTVRDREASPIARFRVPGGGEFLLKGLPTGDWYLTADIGGEEPLRKRVRVREGEEPRRYEFAVRIEGTPFQAVIPSSADGSPQPCGVYIPPRYDRRKAYPLLVALHGTSGNVTEFLDTLGMPLPGELGEVFIVVPYGHGNSGFDGIGETDLWEAVGLIRQRFSIDENRVYLIGHTMGAGAALRLATLRPGIFAAAAFVEPVVDPTIEGSVPPYVETLFRESFPFECIANLARTPTYWIHSASDEIVPAEHSRRGVRALTGLGAPVKERELPLDRPPSWDDVLADREVLRWLLSQERRPIEGPVDFRTPTIRYPRDRWVEILRFAGDVRPARVEAKIEVEDQVGVYTTAVGALQVDLDLLPFDPGDEVTVLMNNQPVFDGEMSRGTTVRMELEETLIGPRKTRNVCGPWRQAFARPFVYVVGNETERTALREKIASLPPEETFFLPPGIVRLPPELTEEERETRNLVCFGTPGTNSVLRELLHATPVRIEDGKVRLGSTVVGGEDLSLHLVYPSPYSDSHLVQINAGVTGEIPLDFDAARYHIPDFMVLDAEGRSDPTGWEAVAAGWFTAEWTLDEGAMYLRDRDHTRVAE